MRTFVMLCLKKKKVNMPWFACVCPFTWFFFSTWSTCFFASVIFLKQQSVFSSSSVSFLEAFSYCPFLFSSTLNLFCNWKSQWSCGSVGAMQITWKLAYFELSHWLPKNVFRSFCVTRRINGQKPTEDKNNLWACTKKKS